MVVLVWILCLPPEEGLWFGVIESIYTVEEAARFDAVKKSVVVFSSLGLVDEAARVQIPSDDEPIPLDVGLNQFEDLLDIWVGPVVDNGNVDTRDHQIIICRIQLRCYGPTPIFDGVERNFLQFTVRTIDSATPTAAFDGGDRGAIGVRG